MKQKCQCRLDTAMWYADVSFVSGYSIYKQK